MISVEWNKDNLESFEKKMETLLKRLPEATKLGVNDALKNTQEKALKNKRGNKDEKLIPIEILDFDKGKVVGRVYTNMPISNSGKYESYAPMIEYGTGIKGELPVVGNTPTFVKSGFRFWLVPKENIKKELSPQRIINIDGKEFYLAFATRPYPFMRPAAFSSRQENADLVNKRIGKLLMEVLK